MSPRVLSQWVDGEVDVQVELQALGLRICVAYGRWNILCPQFKKQLVIPIIERTQEISLHGNMFKGMKIHKMSQIKAKGLVVGNVLQQGGISFTFFTK